ncbi:hypothetical protein HI914_00927 [Erysiphe necator]|uniref:Roadblock/LAMTOR2 domain-containing protein n=1 Tax=Uncinula necator TaxID=52586 RepID=A0A0B1P7F5_UNCNE|nr:hypothetical protein HI914_00927 [Erysiphe necator]KHJ32846.1 hypothetical protein EV44_g6419 [Erysiphe necator]
MAQTMLLTKNLTEFLSKNTNATIHTLLLVSPAGKLLSSSSSLPASRLRTQATLAHSLWSLYFPSVNFITEALPAIEQDAADKHELSTITIQFTHGLMIIRALECGILLVAINTCDIVSRLSASFSTASTPPSSFRGSGNGFDSVISTGTPNSRESQTTDIMQFQKQAEEVAKWLDNQLGDFKLYDGENRL